MSETDIVEILEQMLGYWQNPKTKDQLFTECVKDKVNSTIEQYQLEVDKIEHSLNSIRYKDPWLYNTIIMEMMNKNRI